MTNIAKKIGSVSMLSALLVLGGCKTLEVENLNGVSVDGLTNNPSPTAIFTATQNLMSTWRSISQDGAATLSKYGYETWQMRASEPRTLTNVVQAPKTGGYWSYSSVKNTLLLLDAVEAATALTATEKEALRGWLKTVLAAIYQEMAQAHNPYGIVLDLAADPLGETPATIATYAEAYARIFQLLDEAYTSLGSGGSSFPFKLHTGFSGFTNPSTTFRQLNRALYAKYKVLFATPATNHAVAGNTPSADANWNDALTAIGQSFINSGASGLTFAGLHAGPRHVYPAGETTNPLASVDRFVNNRFRTTAQCKTASPCSAAHAADTTAADVIANRDDRAWGATAKARTIAEFSYIGVKTVLKQTDYFSPSQSATIGTQSSLPLLRNEELILLRAEINYNLGNYSAAIADMNLIRANRGGLPDLADPYVPDAALLQRPTLLEALLYEKSWSMWAENAQTWLNFKHYGMIDQIPHYFPEFLIFAFFPIPDEECLIRGYSTPGCFESGYTGIATGPNL